MRLVPLFAGLLRVLVALLLNAPPLTGISIYAAHACNRMHLSRPDELTVLIQNQPAAVSAFSFSLPSLHSSRYITRATRIFDPPIFPVVLQAIERFSLTQASRWSTGAIRMTAYII